MTAPPSGTADVLGPGVEGTAWTMVTDDMTASRVGSGTVAVLATPEVLALVERAAMASLDGLLPKGSTSVGTHVSLDHLAPTLPGAEACARARLEAVEGRTLLFSFTVSDAAGEIARGEHGRVVVDPDRFEAKARRRSSAG